MKIFAKKLNLPANTDLGSSNFATMVWFVQMEKTLKKSPDLALKYNKVLSEYVILGHMKPTSSFEIIANFKFLLLYLPHHAVVKPERTSSKVKIVFNAIRNCFITRHSLQWSHTTK